MSSFVSQTVSKLAAIGAAVIVGALAMTPAFASAATASTVPSPIAGTTVASWTFNQVTGSSTTVLDSSGFKHNGIIDPNANQFDFGYDSTISTYVGAFHANDARILVPASSQLSPGANDVAVGISFKTTDLHSNIMQAGTTQTDQDFIKIEMASSQNHTIAGVPRCHFTGTTSEPVGGYILLADKSYADGQWHTVRCDKTANYIVMRIDGQVVNSRKVTVGDINIANEEWTIGGKLLANNPTGTSQSDMFDGLLRNAFIIID